MAVETLKSAYDRGVADGMIQIRLDHHDERLAEHAVLTAKLAENDRVLTAVVQTLTEARVSDAATRVATAQALKESKENQDAQAKAGWSPAAKIITILGAVLTASILIWALLDRISSALAK